MYDVNALSCGGIEIKDGGGGGKRILVVEQHRNLVFPILVIKMCISFRLPVSLVSHHTRTLAIFIVSCFANL